MGLKRDEDHHRRGTHPRKGEASVFAFAPKGNNAGLDLTKFDDSGWIGCSPALNDEFARRLGAGLLAMPGVSQMACATHKTSNG